MAVTNIMNKAIKEFFAIDRKPRRGLLWQEWAVLAYLVITLLVVLFIYTKTVNPESMIWGRMRIVAMMAGMWAVYRLVPCRFTMAIRIISQMVLLAWWYPDTYELNRISPNLDHLFASWEQSLFGFQPALTFVATYPSHVVSELMDMGYASYYPLIVFTVLCYIFYDYKQMERCAFIILVSFFAYYVIFDLIPVAGPTFYYKAVGIENITKGIFPDVQDYFNTHRDCLASPGYQDGFFYHLVEDAKAAGERPTAAFPSSHVGVATVCMFLLAHIRKYKLLIILFPLYLLLCLSTVYIQAHYAIDAIAGLISGALFYYVLLRTTEKMS